MSCTPAPLCKQGLADATASWPERDRSSDGICGDQSHQNRQSDHNSGNAFDLTHDPGSGCDAHFQAEQVKRENPAWVTYVISNKRIWNPSISPDWRPYTGSNPHTAHAHFSINTAYRDAVVVFPWSHGRIPLEEPDTMQLVPNYANQLHFFYVGDAGDLWHAWWSHAPGPYGRNAERLGDLSDYDGVPSACVEHDLLHVICDRQGANPPAHWFHDAKTGKWGND